MKPHHKFTDVLASGYRREILGDATEPGGSCKLISAAEVHSHEENLGDVPAFAVAIDGGEHLGGIGGEALDQMDAVRRDKDGEAGAGGLVLDEPDELCAGGDLVIRRNVDEVVEEYVKWAALGSCGKVDEGVGRQRRKFCGRQIVHALVEIEGVEGEHGLRLAVFLDGEIILR